MHINNSSVKCQRISISVLACAYELFHTSLVDDSEYDQRALALDTTSSTDNDALDYFFDTEYTPHSGMWIYKHPELDKLKLLVLNLLARRDAMLAGYSLYPTQSSDSTKK